MPDLKQVLKDFVATSNSGKYTDDATLLSKFPELKGYDINTLKDFVATSNSGRYPNENDLFLQFPEFGLGVKKKVATASSSGSGSSASQKQDEGILDYIGNVASTIGEEVSSAASAAKEGVVAAAEYVGEGIKEGYQYAGNVAAGINKGLLKVGSESVKGLGTFLQWGVGKDALNTSIVDFGNYLSKEIDEITPQDEKFKGSVSDQFSQALGNVAGLIATGGTSKAISLAGKAPSALQMAELAAQVAPKTAGVAATALKTVGSQIASPVGIVGGLQMGQSEFERAKAAGATDKQAYDVFLKNAVVGSALEAIPVTGFLKRFEKASEGGVTNYLKTKAIGGLVGGTEEMTTEVLQQLYANKTAKDIYNTNQNLFEGVGESGGLGFGVGFLLNAMGANAKILKKEGKTQEAAVVEKQAEEFREQMKNGGPSSYTISGIKVNPDVAVPFIQNLSGADLANANIQIVNNPELNNQVQQKIVTHSVREQVRQANPELNEPSLNAIADLEIQLRALDGNTTQTGKDKAAAIRTQIKNIQENQLQEEAVALTKEESVNKLIKIFVPKIEDPNFEITNWDKNLVSQIKDNPIQFIDSLLDLNKREIEANPQGANVGLLNNLTKKLEEAKKDYLNAEAAQAVQPTQAVQPAQPTQPAQVTAEPTIVVHSPVNGFGLQYSENVAQENITAPQDPRGMVTEEQQSELNRGKSIINEDTTLENGDKKVSILSEAYDAFGRKGVSVFDFVIPSNNQSTADGVKLIIEEVRKENLFTDLSPNELINQTVSKVKEYLDSNKTNTQQNAIQEQTTNEGLLLSQAAKLGLQQMGEGNIQPQVTTTRTQEVAPTQPQEVVNINIKNIVDEEGNINTYSLKAAVVDSPALINVNKNTIENTVGYLRQIADKVNDKELNDTVTYLEDASNMLLSIKNMEEGKRNEFLSNQENFYSDKKPPSEVLKRLNDWAKVLKGNTAKNNAERLLKEQYQQVLAEIERRFINEKQKPNRPKLLEATQTVSSKTQAPKFVKDISALITPATVRGFSPLTERIKKLSLNYDKLVKQYAKKKDPKVLAKIKAAEAQILNDAKQEIIDAVAKVDGVAVQFKDTKRGLWDKKFEPSFNMTLSISPQADTKKVSDLLFDFAEKYSQDSFILETESELHDEWVNGNIAMPLTELDENKLQNYPQIIYTFAEPITDEQVADLSIALENGGVDAFNINNNEIKVSVITFLSEEQQNNLTKDEQYNEKLKDFQSKSSATANAVGEILGSNAVDGRDVVIQKSSYQGATNEGTQDPTRKFDRSDILKAFQESTTKVEKLAVELADLRQKEIDLQKEGKKLSAEDQTRFNELLKKVQPAVQGTFEANKKLYEDAKTEVEGIAQDAIAQVDASISPFPIKRAERASVKAIRWYNAFTEKLGDGSRVNIVVDTDANADKVFKIIDEKYPGDNEVRRITETTDLGYPKRLIEIRTSNGTIAEIQVITNEAYLAKDGIQGFTGDSKQKATAKQKLDAVRARLGWNIPDGLGHYFYEIQRDTNVDENLRDEAARLSDLYYDAFTNPKSTLTESFMRDVETFKKNVDAADKSEWDVGNNGKAPQSLIDYKPTKAVVTAEVEEEVFQPITAKDVKTDAFTKDNALDYEEDERESDSGRISTYLSSITVEATNADGDPIGTVTKLTDEDKIFYFTVEDSEGNQLNLDGYDTLGEAKKALADSYNKIQKKEFDKAAKKKAKAAEKAAQKVGGIIETVDDLLALDPNDKTTLQKSSEFLDRAIKDIDKFGKENTSFGIALPVVKKILQAIKVLVDAGISIQEAIKRVSADNNVSQDSVKDILNITPIQKEYDALMIKVDELIARQKSRGVDNAKITRNVDTYIRNSDVYDNANDAQKKIMEREGRSKMEAPARRSVSMGRVLGALKDITNISRQEKMQVIKQIRELSRDAAKDLANEIRDLAKAGKITVNQAANVIARFGKVNMLNEVSVSNFVDYMSKVFTDAEYVNKIEQAKSRLKTAKKNIATKIGIADGLNLSLQKLFSINPTLIPETSLDKYLELVNMFGQRQAVLSLEEKSEVTKDVDSILNEINEEQSVANELADRFNYFEGKVFDDDGNLKYADTINKMVEEEVIDEKEAEIMRKYKSDIAPQVGKTKMTEQEIAEEKAELLEVLDKTQVETSGLATADERKLANRLKDLLSTSAVKELNNTDLKNLIKVIDNINNNYLPHYAYLMVKKLNSKNNAKTLTSAIKSAVVAKLSGLYSRVKSLITRRGAIEEMIRRNPLFNIDQLFGNYKTKDIFNSILSKAAEGEAKFKAELKKIQNILEKAEEKVAKSFKLDPNKTLMSKFKMMTYMVQLENDSNQGSKQVNPASEYLKATIKHIDEGKSAFGERDSDMLQEILDKYSDADGNIDNQKLYDSFNQAEKDAINDIRGVNESLREKAEYTAAIIRGDRINPLTNYVHLNVLQDNQPNDLTAGTAFITEYNNSMRPSTRAKSLIARTGKVSPLNFDIFASAQRGAKFVLMDYNLTEPIQTARQTINETIANFEEEGRIPKEKRQIINAINSALEETTENLLTNSFVTTSIADDAVDYINKQGYRAVLAGTSRFVSELSSNIGFAVISDPQALNTGIENRGIVMSTEAPVIMENVNSKQTSRIFPTDTLSGKMIDTNILQQTGGIKGGKSKNPVANKTQQIWNLSGKKYTNIVELIADSLISTPDKLIMRPMWFGSFANHFKSITGENVDFEKIAANDETYMEENKEAIDKAKDYADERSVMVGATDNAFMGILKGSVKPNQSVSLRAFNNFNNFMTKFLIFEFVTARTAINAAMGNGSLSRKQGAAVLGAVTTRMITYGLITQMLGSGLMGLFFDDQEPEDDKSFLQKVGQQMTSAFTSLIFGRDFGNATKAIVNYGLEKGNEKYLDFLREGEYDPYKDAIQYTIVPPEKKGKERDLSDFLLNMGGAFGPSLKTADLIVRKALGAEKKTEDAISRSEEENYVRIPLEILGNAGFIPLYKDIRKAVMKSIYSSLESSGKSTNKSSRKGISGGESSSSKLQGYESQSDMKRYNPELWDRTYGPNAPDYDEEQAKKAIKKTKDSLERAMKDEMYDYIPKAKGGFGSSGFGSGGFGGKQSRSKGGFGTAKFGQ